MKNAIIITLEGTQLKISSNKGTDFPTLLHLLLSGKLNDSIIKECADEESLIEVARQVSKIPLIRAGDYGTR